MVRTSVLNDTLNAINNAEKAAKRQVLVRPSSKDIVHFLSVMQKHAAWSSHSLPTPARVYITRRCSFLHFHVHRLLNAREIDIICDKLTRFSYFLSCVMKRLIYRNILTISRIHWRV